MQISGVKQSIEKVKLRTSNYGRIRMVTPKKPKESKETSKGKNVINVVKQVP